MKKRKTITYNKLVRDRIPEIIRKDGWEAKTKILNTRGYISALKKKIAEEAQGFSQTRTKKEVIEELADLEECMEAVRHAEGIPMYAVERIKREKRRKRGGFEKRIFLLKTMKLYGKTH